MFITPDMAYTAKLAWAYFTYILMTLVYTAITIPYISDWRHHGRSGRAFERQRVSFCDDQNRRVSGDDCGSDAGGLAGTG